MKTLLFMRTIIREIARSYVPDPSQLDKTAKRKKQWQQAGEDGKAEEIQALSDDKPMKEILIQVTLLNTDIDNDMVHDSEVSDPSFSVLVSSTSNSRTGIVIPTFA